MTKRAMDTAPAGNYKVGEPYQINGVWYYPHEDYDYREDGIASWYGEQFHGKATANGEKYDMNAVTAAHRTLPMPSILRVTNLANNRTLVVRVNDRGPFANDRVLDLSRRSAQLLGFETAGTTRVRLEILAEDSIALKSQLLRGVAVADAPKVTAAPRATVASEGLEPLPVTGRPMPAPAAIASQPKAVPMQVALKPVPAPAQPVAARTAPLPKPLPAVFVQAASFSAETSAKSLAAKLKAFGKADVAPDTVGAKRVFRVRVGPFTDDGDAQATLARIKKAGYVDARVVRN